VLALVLIGIWLQKATTEKICIDATCSVVDNLSIIVAIDLTLTAANRAKFMAASQNLIQVTKILINSLHAW
jgi:hypothetical protein